MLVLREDPDHEGFQDITEIVREMKLQVDYGYYSDGWMDEHASLTVMAGAVSYTHLDVYKRQPTASMTAKLRYNDVRLGRNRIGGNVECRLFCWPADWEPGFAVW